MEDAKLLGLYRTDWIVSGENKRKINVTKKQNKTQIYRGWVI
jgi:hypothetical protein